MKKLYLIRNALISVLGFSQEKNKIEKMGLYSTTTINLGLDLVQMIADKGKDYELQNSPQKIMV